MSNPISVVELQRFYDEAIIARKTSFYVQGDDKSYEFITDYAQYMIQWFNKYGVTEFRLKDDNIAFTSKFSERKVLT